MLEPLIVSTQVCDLISNKLGLQLHRRGTGLFGVDTPRKRLLILGDVDTDLVAYLSKFAVDITIVRTVPRPLPADLPTPREYIGVAQLSAMDSAQFETLLVADPETLLVGDTVYHLWRLLTGHSKILVWVPSYATDPINEDTKNSLGCVRQDSVNLTEYNHPGNKLHYLEARKDLSVFCKK
jgi:hypothetical protein